jgi:hypothetical protein
VGGPFSRSEQVEAVVRCVGDTMPPVPGVATVPRSPEPRPPLAATLRDGTPVRIRSALDRAWTHAPSGAPWP